MSNLEKFSQVYGEELEKAVRTHPQEYGFPVEKVPAVVEKMVVAFRERTYNKDGRAIKATCKRLNIAHTYKAINQYLG